MRTQRIAARARADIRNALQTSRRMFGARAKRDYKALIDRALILLCEKPDRAGVRRRDDLAGAACLFHLRHARARGASPKAPRHVIVFTYDTATLYVLRVLYDAMDLDLHLGGTPED